MNNRSFMLTGALWAIVNKLFSESFYTTFMEKKKKRNSSKQLISFFFSHKKFIKIFPKPIPHNKMNYKT